MNNKLIITAIVIIVIIGGGFFILNRNNPQTTVTPSSEQPSAAATTQVSPSSSAAAQTTGQTAVQISNYSFSPATLTVKAGDTVTWTNNDSMGHSATADDNSFDTGIIAPGKSGTATFSKAGTYTYHCSVHPYMKGTIIVQ